MKTIRVSVTSIDSWQYWKDHESKSYAELLSELRGEAIENEAMRRGSAFHKALEVAEPGDTDYLQAKGYRFHIETDIAIALTPIRELKLERVYRVTDEVCIELVGKVDAMYGNRIEDHKTTDKTGSRFGEWMETLMGGFQWRHYLNIAEGDTFQWNCFVLDETFAQPIETGGMVVYNVKDFQQFSQHRYPNLEQDCAENLKEFVLSLGLHRMRYSGSYCTLANLLKANQGRQHGVV